MCRFVGGPYIYLPVTPGGQKLLSVSQLSIPISLDPMHEMRMSNALLLNKILSSLLYEREGF